MTGSIDPRDDVTQGSEASVTSRTVEQAAPAPGVVAPVIIYVGLCVILAIACAALLLAVLAA